MVVRDVLGTKTWFDDTEADANLAVERQVQENDTFVVYNDLLDSGDEHENSAMYHIEPGTPKTAIKIGDIDWDQATGINISQAYVAGAGGETVVGGDSVQQAVQKLDGNIAKEIVDRTNDVNTQIAQEVSDRNAAISAAIAQERIDTTTDITTSQNAQDAKLASVLNGEGASLIGIEDAAANITATTVEGALAENRVIIDQNEADITALQSDVATNQANIASNDVDIAANATAISTLETELASNNAGEGASMVGIEDAAGKFTATTVEGTLAEIDDKINNLNLVEQERGVYEALASGIATLNLASDFTDVLGGGGVVQDLSDATYINATLVRDGAILIGGVGYTISGSTLTFTAAGGGDLIDGEVIELKVLRIS